MFVVVTLEGATTVAFVVSILGTPRELCFYL